MNPWALLTAFLTGWACVGFLCFVCWYERSSRDFRDQSKFVKWLAIFMAGPGLWCVAFVIYWNGDDL